MYVFCSLLFKCTISWNLGKPEDDNSLLLKYCTMIDQYITRWMSRCILNIVPYDVKLIFRKCEKSNKKYIDLVMHREFNKICLKENLLPNYSEIWFYSDQWKLMKSPSPGTPYA